MDDTLPTGDTPETMRYDNWTSAVAEHSRRLSGWVEGRRQRSSLQIPHTVYDFLFTYYSFKPSQLLRWSPGTNILLEGATKESFSGAQDFSVVLNGIIMPAKEFPTHRIKYLTWALQYLTRVSEREPLRSCFGLHEWAMLYRTDAPRHSSVPLRVSQEQIVACCEALGLRCTHYDAFRFFTPAAAPRNATQLLRSETHQMDQPGCIHVVMDLYRFAYKIAPFSSSALVADTFELAAAAREIDMRASPYDLRSYNLKPICIEETAGRSEYIELQAKLFQRSIPLRERVKREYLRLLKLVTEKNTDEKADSDVSISMSGKSTANHSDTVSNCID